MFDCNIERINGAGIFDRLAERQIDDADVVSGAVDQDPVERGDDRRDRSRAVCFEHAQRMDAGGRRNAFISTGRRGARTARNTRDVSTVAVRVVVAGWVELNDTACNRIAGAVEVIDGREVRMSRHARVDDGDADV